MNSRLLLRLSRRLFSSSPNPNPNPNSFSKPLRTTVNYLFRERDPDKLVAAFKQSSESYRFRCKHRIYEIAVLRLAAAGRPDAVAAVLEHQKLYKSDLAREGFGLRLISLYGKARMPDHAVKTFSELPSLGSPRSVKSFNALLTALADSGNADEMITAFSEIPADDPSIVPDLFSYNILIRGLCERGDLDAALGTLDLMEKNGIKPDSVSFNTILKFFYAKKGFADAEEVWTLMERRNLVPDTKSFNIKLRALVSEGKVLEAAELVEELREKGPKPDTFTFNALIKGYCEVGNLEEAKMVFLNLLKNDCAPNRETFQTLIPYLCKAGELDLALRCCNDSMSRRCLVDATVLQGVVDGLFKESRTEEAKKLVELGRTNYYSRKSLRMPSS